MCIFNQRDYELFRSAAFADNKNMGWENGFSVVAINE